LAPSCSGWLLHSEVVTAIVERAEKGDNIDYKEIGCRSSKPDTRELLKDCAAMANASGGNWQSQVEKWTVTQNGPYRPLPYYLRLSTDKELHDSCVCLGNRRNVRISMTLVVSASTILIRVVLPVVTLPLSSPTPPDAGVAAIWSNR
jgi:hypothetical protein